MKIRLQNFSIYSNQVILDTKTFIYNINEGLAHEDEIYQITFHGWYDYLDEKMIMLFYFEGKLILYLNNKFHKLNNQYKVKYQRDNNFGSLNLSFEGLIVSLNYNLEYHRPVSTLLYSEEDEDRDFGLWLTNVLNDKERLEIFIENCGKI